MSHPFSAMFERALKKNSPEKNLVLGEAESLRAKGYSVLEIFEVLQKLKRDLVGDRDIEIVSEAVEEFSRHIEG